MYQGHEFIKVPSDDCEALFDRNLKRISESSEQWLICVAKKYATEQSKEC